MSIFVNGHLDVERTETGQKPEHPGNEQFEGKEDPVVAKVEGEGLDECTSRRRGICEGEEEPHGALGGKDTDVAVQGAFCDRIEEFVDEE